MDESTKTRRIWGELEAGVLRGEGIDIGCGPDPVMPGVQRFDLEDGDANAISKHVAKEFDFVYSSHCLEHMTNPREALSEWWRLVRVGGHLFFIVPDEDLYEQGMFPSRFNVDHKATFTISKTKSWSPVSYNVLDLAQELPGGKLVSLTLQDVGYDRSLGRHNPPTRTFFERVLLRLYRDAKRYTGIEVAPLEHLAEYLTVVDQTMMPGALAQIQCIVKKIG